MQDELDKDLRSLFEEQSRSLPEEPFLGNTLKLIAKRRSRRVFVRRLAYVLGFAGCVYLTQFLVRGSMPLAGGVNAVFNAVNGFVNTSVGMYIVALALLAMLFKRRRISGIV